MTRDVTIKTIALAAILAVVAALAFFSPLPRDVKVLLQNLSIYIGIYAIYVISLNLEVGYLGLPQFGKVMFLIIGAIAVGGIAAKLILLIYQSYLLKAIGVAPLSNVGNYCMLYQYSVGSLVNQQLAQNPALGFGYFLLGIALAMALSAALGVLFAYPAIRLREDYLGILLLVSGEFLRVVTYYATPVACGVNGAVIPDPFAWASGETRTLVFFAITAVMLVVTYLVFDTIGNSPFGRTLRAIRDAETAAAVFGKDIVKFRIRVLAFASAFAGLAGALLAYYFDYTILGTFLPIYTFIGWTMLILGGQGNNVGAIVGAVIYYAIQTVLDIYKNALQAVLHADPTYLAYAIFGLAIILVLMYRPQGIVPEKPVKTVDLYTIRKEVLNKKD
ncbi:inner-membrane translocator [Thermoproteus uzoniensis 768-20]|uniref:Inner-membrane translocator n=1 Tax=Thermoproteus uzoniensis (strain 768-20) TaxID=999630 RepID=F2L5K8_THEU7|nr:branched-chain amino acid ABC transporter permease [Thermoproteus uzoniensis]AEA12379.1 inner-membrane translocator [Thermoproteus uzoniensis 768-20]